MLRFLPDGWAEGLLRPWLLLDPAAGLYLEAAAPDGRFAALLIFVAVAWVAGRGRIPLTAAQTGAAISLLVMFYVWTFVIGNGRYFAAGLVLVGPLVLVFWRLLPGTRSFRVLALLGVLGLQAHTVYLHYNANVWGLQPWRQGAGLNIAPSVLQTKPAVFLTITGISYSLLVPAFHPQSRWANVLGQVNITPALPEYVRLQSLLSSELPMYVVSPIHPQFTSPSAQPTEAMAEFLQRSLAVHGLVMGGGPCVALRSTLSVGAPVQVEQPIPRQGFWFCPVHRTPGQQAKPPGMSERVQLLRDVFERVELACPRFFPPGRGAETEADDLVSRHYTASDTRLYVSADGTVYFKYFRSLNPTRVGHVDDVRSNRFAIDCKKLPGRYVPPWARD